MLFSAAAKLDLATALKERFQDRRLRIPEGDPVLRADLHTIKSQVGITGQRRLIADGDTDGHADRFWAAALVAGAARTDYQPFAYRPVSDRRGDDRPDLDDDMPGTLDFSRPPLGARLRGRL